MSDLVILTNFNRGDPSIEIALKLFEINSHDGEATIAALFNISYLVVKISDIRTSNDVEVILTCQLLHSAKQLRRNILWKANAVHST